VRAQDHRYRFGAKHCSKSNSRASLRESTYDECDRSESCSKDPIGYADSLCQFEYVNSQPLINSDWTGKLSAKFDDVTPAKSWALACEYPIGFSQYFDVGPNLGGGYVIQRIDYSCGFKACPCNQGETEPANDEKLTIYEAFYVPPLHSRTQNSDIWLLGAPKKGTCGKTRIYGKAAFYSGVDLSNNQLLLDPNADTVDVWHRQFKVMCGKPFTFGPSPRDPTKLPDFVKKTQSIPANPVTHLEREFWREWKCCCDEYLDENKSRDWLSWNNGTIEPFEE
jgi:hypothetical protein